MAIPVKKDEVFEGRHFPFRIIKQNESGEITRPHWHEHLEFIKILSGNVRMAIDNNILLPNQNDILFINSCRVHSIYTVTEAPASLLCMSFDRFFLTNIIEGFDTRYFYSLFTHTGYSKISFEEAHPLWPVINGCIENSFAEYAQQDICFEMSIKSYIYRLITTLLRFYAGEILGEEIPMKTFKELNRLKPVLDYIDMHYPQKITVDRLGRLLDLSPFHFTRYFKKVIGKTPVDYINQVRINEAMKLLMDSALTVTGISEKTGFCNSNYFDKVFKEYTSSTPMEFRRHILYQK